MSRIDELSKLLEYRQELSSSVPTVQDLVSISNDIVDSFGIYMGNKSCISRDCWFKTKLTADELINGHKRCFFRIKVCIPNGEISSYYMWLELYLEIIDGDCMLILSDGSKCPTIDLDRLCEFLYTVIQHNLYEELINE